MKVDYVLLGELIKFWRQKRNLTQEMLAEKIQEMCLEFISGYDHYLKHAEVQTGEPTYYKKRSPQDSQLDISKSIEEQFNLLRVVDNEKYPAFFVKDGVRYVVKIYQDKN